MRFFGAMEVYMRMASFAALVCFLLLSVLSVQAEAGYKNRRCPAAAALEVAINAKSNDVKSLDDQIKVLRKEAKDRQAAERVARELSRSKKEADRKSKMADVKRKDPELYRIMVAEEIDRNMKKEKRRKKKIEEIGNKPPESSEQRLQRIKRKNPGIYELTAKKDKLRSEIKALRLKLVEAQEACFNQK